MWSSFIGSPLFSSCYRVSLVLWARAHSFSSFVLSNFLHDGKVAENPEEAGVFFLPRVALMML